MWGGNVWLAYAGFLFTIGKYSYLKTPIHSRYMSLCISISATVKFSVIHSMLQSSEEKKLEITNGSQHMRINMDNVIRMNRSVASTAKKYVSVECEIWKEAHHFIYRFVLILFFHIVSAANERSSKWTKWTN